MIQINTIGHLADESQGTYRQNFGKITGLHGIKK